MRLAVVLLSFALLGGCASTLRTNPIPDHILNSPTLPIVSKLSYTKATVRFWGDTYSPELKAAFLTKLKQTAKRLKNTALSSRFERNETNGKLIVPTYFLALSGGAEDGAYGAGVLSTWKNPKTGRLPAFNTVTGISTGALIAPIAFLASSDDPQIRAKYLPKLGDIYKVPGDKLASLQIISAFTGSAAAFLDNSGLQHQIETFANKQMIEDVARESNKGRSLLIGTTNLEAQRPVIWDLGAIATRPHNESKEKRLARHELFRKILLASTAVPGAFPPVKIQINADDTVYEELHVDGGTSKQVFLFPSEIHLNQVAVAVNKMMGNGPGIELRYELYIIRNGRVHTRGKRVEPKGLASFVPILASTIPIIQRSIATLIHYQGRGDLHRLRNLACLYDIKYHLTAIPDSFTEQAETTYDLTYMNHLYKAGQAFGARANTRNTILYTNQNRDRAGSHWYRGPPEWKKCSNNSSSHN